MIIYKFYDIKKEMEEIWYDSSSLIYSKFIEEEGNLYVVFQGGSQYVYHDVDVATDYTMFKFGGLNGSQGKALNKYIKGKYEYERIEDADLGKLMERRQELERKEEEEKRRKETVFISGHRNITEEEFNEIYVPAIKYALWKHRRANFVIGDYEGVDIMAQNYLMDEEFLDPGRVTVYHMFDKPRNVNPKITRLVGGFETDEERDAAMTNDSVEDIAFVRDHLHMSGTAMNLLRRNSLKNAREKNEENALEMKGNPLGPYFTPDELNVLEDVGQEENPE